MGAGTNADVRRSLMSITIDKDLRGLLGPARDQDPRPTCMAFAASDAHAAARPGWEPLSVEWAYYHALKREKSSPHVGVAMGTMLATLREDGQPVEAVWPYITSPFPDPDKYVPPSTSEPVFCRDSTPVNPVIDQIIVQLTQDFPVLFTMSISRSFFFARPDGLITGNEPIEPHRVHALVAVGYGHFRTDRFILARNSWGEDWALDGHAWLGFQYLQPRLLAAATLTKEP